MRMPLFLRFGEDAYHEKAVRRLRKVSTTQVYDWAMQSLWGTQEGLERYQIHSDEAGLEEARRGLISLLAATDVLQERHRA